MICTGGSSLRPSFILELARSAFIVSKRTGAPYLPNPTSFPKNHKFCSSINIFLRSPHYYAKVSETKMKTPMFEHAYLNLVKKTHLLR
jgi:hypothetical protein